MNRYYKLTLLIFCFLLGSFNSNAQSQEILRMENGKLILRISTNISQKQLDSVLSKINMMKMSMDSLKNKYLNSVYIAEGWELITYESDYVELEKRIQDAQHKLEFLGMDVFSLNNNNEINTFYPSANFGYNNFRSKVSVKPLNNNGLTRFVCYSKLKANEIFLSGSFNSWATQDLKMIKTDTAWYCDVVLKEGKHLYKFIIDGEWFSDTENKLKESDLYGGNNSIYFSCNYEFKLNGYMDAKKVIVSGTFNQWDEKELQLKKSNGYWYLPIYVKEGTYSYKFIVDKKWMTDPSSSNNHDDGSGNINSYFSIGEPSYFELKGFDNAKNVFVAGSFNDWRSNEIRLTKENNVWTTSYVLAPGNYQYKFIIDGTWYTDPSNTLSIGENDSKNSIKIVKPNYTFRLKKYLNAKDVRLSGSFMDWPNPGLVMNKSDSLWYLNVFLTPGKHHYKFIIDGKWITDPDNPLYEENEFQTGNSFIWIDEKRLIK